jgi:Zn-dependent M28 family amino/carboxypeptidase
MTFNADVDPMPVAIVAREQAERLLRLAAVESVRVRLAIDNLVKTKVPSRNVVAEIRGSARPEEYVVVGAHLDSFDLGTGANDNGVSCAEVIDLARQIKAAGLVPKRTIRFILFTGEEQGMIGSRAYVASHASEMDRHAAAVIFDIGSGRLTGWFLNGREDVRASVETASARLSSLGPFTNLIDGLDGTDNFDFLLAGVPNLVGFQDPAPYLPDYHAESDTFDKVDAREAKSAEAVLASVVWELANAPERAPRQTRDEIEALLRATKVDEQMKAWAQWDDWAAGRRGRAKVTPSSAPK